MSYKPNFADPRILSRTKKCLSFVELYLRPTRVNWVASAELYKVFGNTSRPLSRYLKEALLTVADPYYNKATRACIKYRLNADGMRQLKQAAGLEDFVPEIDRELEQQLESGEFEYTVKSDRLFNQIQFYNREIRGSILSNHGYRYNYDIEAAAPTLLLQRARQRKNDFAAPALEQYMSNRSQIRKQLAQECEISEDHVKFVINAVLQGAVISCYGDSKIFNELNCNYDAIKKLQNNQLLCEIRSDIRDMWKILKEDFPVRYVTDKLGRTRSARLSGRDKSSYYRELELEVGKVIRRYLKKHSVRCFWIHDGWCCDKAIDTNELCAEVRRQTDFVIKLDCGVYE